MKILVLVVLIALAAVGGWFLGRNAPPAAEKSGERQVAFYQSSMHPWIKSDKPGNCTICGMKLTPVFEGEQGLTTDANVVTLSSNSINVINVQSEQAQVRAIERTLKVAGKIETDETRLRVISAYVDGRIDQLFVNFSGAEVQAGEPLAMLYSPALLTAEREYLTLLGQTNFAGNPALQGQQERLVEGARQRLRRLGLSEEQIGGMQQGGTTNFTTRIVAPMSGTVVVRAVAEGQYVEEGEKLFEVADLSRMWFQFEVYEQDLPFVKLGAVVRVSSPALGAKTFEGPITFVDPNINQATRSARVRVELQNPVIEQDGKSRRELFNGLYAEGSIAIKTEPVLAVSRGVVLQPGDGARVYIDQGGGAYEHRPVKVGRQGEEFIEILDGLDEGDRVVSSGNLLLDSQAQLNRSSSPAVPTGEAEMISEHPPEKANEQSLAQDQTAAKEYLAFVSGLNEHLAADNLEGYNDLLTRTSETTSSFALAFGEALPLKLQADRIVAESKKLKPAPDLATARAQHNPYSKATVDFYRAAKASGAIEVPIYRCPMYPKMGQNAFWVQAEGPLRNPFYGAEMLECGVEVK